MRKNIDAERLPPRRKGGANTSHLALDRWVVRRKRDPGEIGLSTREIEPRGVIMSIALLDRAVRARHVGSVVVLSLVATLVVAGCGGGGADDGGPPGGSGTATGSSGTPSTPSTPSTAAVASVVYSFTPADGNYPSGLMLAGDGNFYGTVESGGATNNGGVFKMTPGGIVSMLHFFGVTANDGTIPFGTLVQGTDGNLYGTTDSGGANNGGVLYRISPAGQESVIFSFGSGVNTSPAAPNGTLIRTSTGLLYGTTDSGGTHYGGTLFSATTSGVVATIYAFGGGGANWSGTTRAVTSGADGKLYGVSQNGGANGVGTVFSVSPTGSYTNLHSFDATGSPILGNSNADALAQATDGNFYGITGPASDGSNGGKIFRISPTGAYADLHVFPANSGTDGCQPNAGLTQASDGNLYGTTEKCGANNVGIIYKLTLAGEYSVAYSFTNNPGDAVLPSSTLLQGSDGYLYGASLGGNGGGHGAIYKIKLF